MDALAAAYALPDFGWEGETYTPAELVEGMVLTESSGNPMARRYEPAYDRPGRADAPSDADRAGVDDGAVEDDSSYGLLQVMGWNWRAMVGAPPATPLKYELLYDPAVGLAAGLRVLSGELRALYREHPTGDEGTRLLRALARYNGGHTGDDVGADGRMRRHVYVAKVASNTALARADRRAR